MPRAARYWKDPEKARTEAGKYYRANRPAVLEKAATYRDGHREVLREKNRRYRENEPEKAAAATRAWQTRNRERHNELNRASRERNLESSRKRCCANEGRRRARKRNAPGDANTEQIEARAAFYGWLCYLCGDPYEAMDHVIPLADGGSNWPANLRPICSSCNTRKGAKRLVDFCRVSETQGAI